MRIKDRSKRFHRAFLKTRVKKKTSSCFLISFAVNIFFCSGVLTAQAQFLDFSQPARAVALGGNLVALPEGSAAPAFNPAGLGLQEQFEASARYASLFPGL